MCHIVNILCLLLHCTWTYIWICVCSLFLLFKRCETGSWVDCSVLSVSNSMSAYSPSLMHNPISPYQCLPITLLLTVLWFCVSPFLCAIVCVFEKHFSDSRPNFGSVCFHMIMVHYLNFHLPSDHTLSTSFYSTIISAVMLHYSDFKPLMTILFLHLLYCTSMQFGKSE